RVETLRGGRHPVLARQGRVAVEDHAAAPDLRERVDAVTAQQRGVVLVEIDERRQARLQRAARPSGEAALLIAAREKTCESAARRHAGRKARELAARA